MKKAVKLQVRKKMDAILELRIPIRGFNADCICFEIGKNEMIFSSVSERVYFDLNHSFLEPLPVQCEVPKKIQAKEQKCENEICYQDLERMFTKGKTSYAKCNLSEYQDTISRVGAGLLQVEQAETVKELRKRKKKCAK